MSHVSKFSLRVTNLDALEDACKDLGLELKRGQKSYRWFGRSVGDYPLPAGFTVSDLGRCDHAIRIPENTSAYEIGVCRARDGEGYELLCDFWNGGYGMQAKVGNNSSKLAQRYQVHHAESYWQQKGYQTIEEQLDNGEVLLRVRR